MKLCEIAAGNDIEDIEYADYKFPDKILAVVNKWCPNNFKAVMTGSAPLIYRGASIPLKTVGNVAYAVHAPRTEARQSVGGNNFLLNFVSNLSSWKNIPSRKFSYFCSPGAEESTEFSSTRTDLPHPSAQLVIPFDNVASYAVSPMDFNYLYLKNIDGDISVILDELDYAFMNVKTLVELSHDPHLMEIIKPLSDDEFDTAEKVLTFSKILTQLNDYFTDNNDLTNSTDKHISKCVSEITRVIKTFNPNLWDWLQSNLSPASLEIKTYNSLKQIKIRTEQEEIWFEGGYVALVFNDAPENELSKKFLKRLL